MNIAILSHELKLFYLFALSIICKIKWSQFVPGLVNIALGLLIFNCYVYVLLYNIGVRNCSFFPISCSSFKIPVFLMSINVFLL